jgi:ubiquitin C-terminal hydrolase
LKIHPSEHDYYKCDECGERMVKFYRAERLKMLREIVVIIFNKFQSKENRWFPQELSFKAKDGKPSLKYKLVGKIEHSGNASSGHYWA